MLKTMMNINSYKKREDDESKREMVIIVFSHRQIVEAKSGYSNVKLISKINVLLNTGSAEMTVSV